MPYTMIVPPVAQTQSIPLVMFGHGLFGSGRDYLTTEFGSTIQPLSQTLGGAVAATDWIGLSSSDMQLIIDNVAPNLNNIGIVSDRLLQSVVNNTALTELCLGALGNDSRVRPSTAQPLFDPTRVYYYGVSLGGIEGSSFISVSRRVTRAVVAVPGASWSNLLARSIDYGMFQTVINLMYPDPLLEQEFLSLLQVRFDPADPVNLATLYLQHPLSDAPANRIVLLQEAIGDCEVPNITTEILARTYGTVSQITPDIQPIYGLTDSTAPASSSGLSQYELQADYAMYAPGLSNVLPTMDNGEHSHLAFQPPVIAQMATLLETGQLTQDCSTDGGACLLP